jgi:peptidyl-prolyl cis-trans isomerase B (cyclophilin B)
MRPVGFSLVLTSAVAFLAWGCSKEEPQATDPTVVVMETSMGTIKLELNGGKAPITVKNFLSYVDEGFYDGTIFHRVISDFMIQGGGFEPGMKEKKKLRWPIKNEASNGLSNKRGTIAMARTGDPDSATAQFYINVVDNGSKLDKTGRNAGYCVFGKVIEGMGVVDRIKEVATSSRPPHDDVPVDDVIIKSIRRAEP